MVPPEVEAWWKYILTGAAVFAFVLRMEARISAAHAKIEVMQKQRDEDRKEGDKVRAEIKEALADLYREMKSEMQTIQTDIKLLLREHGK
jgi:uncharacterized FlaG/YvyC family protein